VTIVSVAAVSQNRVTKVLSGTDLNVVTASAALAFKVTIHNAEASWEDDVAVTLLVERTAPRHIPIIQTRTLASIGPNQTETVAFGNIGPVPYATPTNVRVKVANGKAMVFPIVFFLASG
jgi:hypothetical protein